MRTCQEYTAWGNQTQCDPRDSGIGVQWVRGSDPYGLIQQVNVDWSPPVSGLYWVLVETFSGPPVVVSADFTGMSAVSSQTVTQILYFTQYTTEVDTISQTSQYITYQGGSSSLQDSAPILIVLTGLTALAIVGYAVIRQKKKPSHA